MIRETGGKKQEKQKMIRHRPDDRNPEFPDVTD